MHDLRRDVSRHRNLIIRFIDGRAVQIENTLKDFNGVPRQPDDPLDIVLGWVVGIVKDDHVAACVIAQAVGQLVHEQVLPVVEVGFHRLAFDAVILDQAADDKKDEHRQDHRFQRFPQQRFEFYAIIVLLIARKGGRVISQVSQRNRAARRNGCGNRLPSWNGGLGALIAYRSGVYGFRGCRDAFRGLCRAGNRPRWQAGFHLRRFRLFLVVEQRFGSDFVA